MLSYREDLEAMFVPGAAFLFLKPRCHPDASVTAAYSKEHGAIVLACTVCNFGVADLAVASRATGVNGLQNMIVLPKPHEAPAIEKPKRRGAGAAAKTAPLQLVPTPTHVQDQRTGAKANRRRRK